MFITLTTQSGSILVNSKLIVSLQDLKESKVGHPKTNVLAGGHTLFVLESVESILQSVSNTSSPTAIEMDTQVERRRSKMFNSVEKKNIKAAKALEALSQSRVAAKNKDTE